MQWRAFIMLCSGMVVIYIANLLQDTPHLHPKKIYTSNHHLWTKKPDKVIISTVGSFLYVTSMQFESSLQDIPQVIGTDKPKLGVQGIIKQYKKPISNLVSTRELIESDGWVECFEHELRGHISQVSQRTMNSTIDKDTWHFAVLYHQVEDVDIKHYVRVYYTSTDERGSLFEYKDIKLPGTTWINAISLEKDSIMYSRDPDKYEFHIMTLPASLTQAPHSNASVDLGLDSIRPGRLEQEWSQPESTEQYAVLLNRLYSPVDETYRTFSLNVHKTKYTFYVNFTIADNVTRYDTDNNPREVWLGREKGGDDYPVYNEEASEYVGYADMSSFQHLANNHLDMPKLYSTLSAESTSIVFPYFRNKFMTLDYTTRVDMLQKIKKSDERLYFSDQTRTSYLDEYFYWQPSVTVDADIMGVQLDEEGDVLAVWTEFNQVYIYQRKSNDTNAQTSLLGKLDQLLDYILSDMSEEEKHIRKTYFPPSWELTMAIAPARNEYGGVRPISTVHFWKNTDNEHFVFVGYKNGNVNSYRLDRHEPPKVVNLWSFATERWDMLFAMSAVVFIYVYNEYQRPSY